MATSYPKRSGTLNTNTILVGAVPVNVQAFGLMAGDCVKFYVIDKQGGTGFTTDGSPCAHIVPPTDSLLINRTLYMIGGKTPVLNSCQTSLVLDIVGEYEIEITGPGAAMLVVKATDTALTMVSDEMRGLNYTQCDCSSGWVDTGEVLCVDHIMEKKQVDQYGNFQWVSTGFECGYSPSEPFVIKEEGCGCSYSRVAYMFGPYQDRPSDANVEISGCDGVVLGYAYDSSSDEHSIPVSGCDGFAFGFLANKSASSPEFIYC